MLTQAQAFELLLRQGLITSRAVIDDGIYLSEVSRRSRNYRVESAGPSYLLKQGVGEEGEAAVAREADIYRLLWRSENAPFHSYLPLFHRYEPTEGVLVIELLDGARDLIEHHGRLGRFPLGTGASVGVALARLHGLLGGGERSADAEALRLEPAWAFSIHQPVIGMLRDLSWGCLEVVRTIQRFPEFADGLEELRAGWTCEALIHGDLKWDNWLYVRRQQPGKRLKLIDWEVAGLGDPRWDVGSVLASYLTYWVRSIDVVAEVPGERLPELARLPLGRMHPSIRAFSSAYVQCRGLELSQELWLVTAVKYAAARLLEEAFSQTQLSDEPSAHALLLIQLALNIMRRPVPALGLLGLSAGHLSRV